MLHSFGPSRRRIERIEKRKLPVLLLLLSALQGGLPGPRPRHCGRREGQERRLANGQRLHLGSLRVAVLELKRSSREEIGHAGLADDDGAVAVGGDDTIPDGLVVIGTAVDGF